MIVTFAFGDISVTANTGVCGGHELYAFNHSGRREVLKGMTTIPVNQYCVLDMQCVHECKNPFFAWGAKYSLREQKSTIL
jgi:hypothetical protein